MPPDVKIIVRKAGALFAGQTDAAIDAFVLAAKADVAQEAVDLIHIHLDRVLKNPTGYYRSRIQSRRVNNDYMVTDNKVVYGGWLEGVDSRNQTTRFKGYRTFRLVAQDIRKVAPFIVDRTLARFIDRFN